MTALFAFALMMSLAGLALLASRVAAQSANVSGRAKLIERINDVLPQTQCGRCTFAGCKPYAAALAEGSADINQCPPGGDSTAQTLAALLNRAPKAVNPQFGAMPATQMIAWIDEPACIGCTKCIQACPVDAIVGASRHMHTVIASDCTGCELCIPPCPVDCIEMRPAATSFTEVIASPPRRALAS